MSSHSLWRNTATFNLPYQTANGTSMPMSFFVYPADEAKARVDFSVLPDVMTYYASILGEYPFLREKYGVAEFRQQSFREHQTVPSLGAAFITGDHKNDQVLAHELAHQWFGNALSVSNWSHVWLNEGFATYSALLWMEHSKGKAAYDASIAARMKLQFPWAVYIRDSTDVGHMFGAVTFQKGALVLHMLRHVMGDSAFFRSLKAYVAENKYHNVATADWQRVCERESHQSLDRFFQQWVYGTGMPSYKLEWTQRRSGNGFAAVDLTVTQEQDSTLFAMPIDIALRTA